MLITHLEEKKPLVDLLLAKSGVPLEDLFKENQANQQDKEEAKKPEEFKEKKFGAHLSKFVMQKNDMKALAAQ